MSGGQSAESDWSLTDDERLKISAVVHQNYYMPDVFKTVEMILRDRDFRAAITRGLEVRFKAVLAACELAEAEARHVVDDEVYVSVGLIRNALRTSHLGPVTSPGQADPQ